LASAQQFEEYKHNEPGAAALSNREFDPLLVTSSEVLLLMALPPRHAAELRRRGRWELRVNKELSSSARTDIFDFTGAAGSASQAPSSNKSPIAIVGSDCPPPSSAEPTPVQAIISQADVPTPTSGGAATVGVSSGQGLDPTSTAPTPTSGTTAPQAPHHQIVATDPVLSSNQEEIRSAVAITAKQHDIDFDVMLGELERVFAGIRRLEAGLQARPKLASKPSFLH
jgi:hypothetical protein